MSHFPDLGGMPDGQMPPHKKTHRGGGRGKGKGGPGAHHHNALNKAMAVGDHAGAKRHALNLANALHGHSKGMVSTDPNLTNGTPAPTPPSGPSGMGFLVNALMARRK